jgi:DNA-binding CsgD family transcriptional regulator
VTATIEHEVRDDAMSKADVEAHSRLARTAPTVLNRVRADLNGTPFSVVIVDALACLVEHPAQPTGEVAIASEPICDPRSGRPLGVVAILCAVEAASELMEPFVRRIRREIEDGLLETTSAAERALTEHFLKARRHARGAVVCLNERTMITNAAAARLVDESDRSMLWDWARQAIARGQTEAEQVSLSRGITATARCEPIDTAGDTIGALVRLDTRSPASSGERAARGKKRALRQTFGWASLSAAQLGIADLVADGLTNGEIAARCYLSPHTVDFHLRQIFAKLTIESRVELARIVSEHAADQRAAS